MENFLKNRRQLATVFFALVIIIMMVQNYFLVKKNKECVKALAATSEQSIDIPRIVEGDFIEAFEAVDLDSNLVTIGPKFLEKRALLLLFTSGCHACINNIDQWNKLIKELPNRDVTIIGISPDPPWRIEEFKTQKTFSFPVYSVASNLSVLKKNKLFAFPETIVIENSGAVLRVWNGTLTDKNRDDIVSYLKTL